MPEKVTITKNKLDSLAEVIGSKSNQNVPLTIEGMEDAVLSLITPIGTKLITENGTYDVTNYANAEVNVPKAFVITPTYAYDSNDGPTWTIDKTYDEVDAAYTAGKTIVVDAKIPYTDYSQYCTATFFMTQDTSSQSYTIMIGWYDDNDNLYYEQYYDAYSNNKTWNLNFQSEYENSKILIEKTITANGTYDPTESTSSSYADGYSKVVVNVPPTTLQSLTVTPSTEQQVFNASFQMGDTALMDGLNLWKYGSVQFSIPLIIGTSYWLVLTRYTGDLGWNDSQINAVYGPILWTATESYSYPFWQNDSSVRVRYDGATNIGNNWRYKITVYPVASSTAYGPVTVEPIPSEYTVPTLQAKTNINPTTSSQTITADNGYDGLSSVQINAMPNGTAGTPVATKGTVSNNSITVTPSVTNTTGYITGSTKTGTAVTVSASELVSGTYNITSSGTKDITNYKNVSISSGTAAVSATKGTVSNNSITVTPSVTTTEGYINANTLTGTAITVSASELVSGTYSITENNTYDVTNIASVVVNVPTGGNVTQDANGYLVLDENGSSSSNSGKSMDDPIRFFDYDGTLVASYTSVPSVLPINPSHTGLIAQGWNWSLADIATQFASSGTCDVGQMYTTSDGKTRIYITVSDVTKSFWFGLCPNGTLSIDWGDGSESSSMTGTSYLAIETVQHTYSTAGSYVISVEVESGEFAFYNANSNFTQLFSKYESTGNYYNQPYGGCVTAIELGDSVRIGNYAFSRLFNMKSITIPDTVTSIGTYAFQYCYALKSITIPDSVTSIGTYTFRYCYSLKSIAIPDSITIIGTYAFQYCYALKFFTIPNNITSIGIYAFHSCYALESITIPDDITNIGTYMFYSCYALRSITIPDDVTSIGTYAFGSCYALKSITIPDDITSISNNTFQYCYALESITIPDSVTSIGNNSFSNCYALESITIPDSVTSIGNNAFSNCYNMDEYHFLPTTPPTLVSITAFSGIQSGCKIYVPYSADHSILTTYQTAENWSTYASYMVEESE